MNPAEFHSLRSAESELWWFRGMQSILFGMLDTFAARLSGARVLEAGCGTGYFASLLAARYGSRVIPSDAAAEGLAVARSRGMSALCQTDISRCPFRSESFDAVFSLDVLVHFQRGDEAAAIAEFHRTLKPGGLLVVRVAALDMLRSRHSMWAHEKQRFTRTRLERVVRAHGFEVLRCTYANSLLVPVAIAKFRMWEPLVQAQPASGTAPVSPWLNRLLRIPLSAESALLRQGVNLPVGQSLILIGQKL